MSGDKAYITPPELPTPTVYTHAVRTRDLVFISGQCGLDAERRVVGPGDVEAQTRQALANIGRLLEASGASWSDVVKLNFYLIDMRQIGRVRDIRGELFAGLGLQPPAATTVGVTALAVEGALIEIEAIAAL